MASSTITSHPLHLQRRSAQTPSGYLTISIAALQSQLSSKTNAWQFFLPCWSLLRGIQKVPCRSIQISPGDSDFVHFLETKIKRREKAVLFAIIDKSKAPMLNDDIHMKIKPPGRIAGIIGWINIAPSNFSLDIGPVIIISRDVCISQRHWTGSQTPLRIPHSWRIEFQTCFLGC
jgi:hypothetical protein